VNQGGAVKLGWTADVHDHYTLFEAWSVVNWADLIAAQGAFGTDLYDRSIFRPKHRAYYCSGRPVIKIGPRGVLGSREIRPIHSAPSLGQSIVWPYPTSSVNIQVSIGQWGRIMKKKLCFL